MISSFTTPMRTTLLFAAAAFTITSAPALAQTTIGAALTTSVGPVSRDPLAFQSFGQSFTVPSLAPRLQRFDLALTNFFNGGALRFDAYIYAFDVAGRRLSGNALWSFANVTGSSNDFDFDTRRFVTGDLLLSPGATYLFLLTTSRQPSVPLDAANLVGANDADAYTGGAFYAASNGSDFDALRSANAFTTLDGVSDAAFSAVFLSSQVVPEPASLWLTGAGLFAVAGLARRRGAPPG